MTFQPIVSGGGLIGWSFLQRTRVAQEAAFENSGPISREVAYFTENIAGVQTAEDLTSDRRLLSVALTAFGLEDDINNTFFIRKVLEEGTIAPDSLANRLSDKRYLELSKAFNFDLTPPSTQLSDFGQRITELFQTRGFEAAVGQTDPDMRLALGLERELATVTGRDLSDDGMWFTIMATPPLRKVFEAALRIPVSVGTLDIDRQLTIFRERAAATFGVESVREFSAPEQIEELRDRFLVTSTTQQQINPLVPGAGALTLLQASQGVPRLI
ncbi:MAG: DUF1217 domain-containing protein [Rhodobacteraceae bacterium]|nr:DUF1217 domain-containing protein [Paracoccaceae bacterium]